MYSDRKSVQSLRHPRGSLHTKFYYLCAQIDDNSGEDDRLHRFFGIKMKGRVRYNRQNLILNPIESELR